MLVPSCLGSPTSSCCEPKSPPALSGEVADNPILGTKSFLAKNSHCAGHTCFPLPGRDGEDAGNTPPSLQSKQPTSSHPEAQQNFMRLLSQQDEAGARGTGTCDANGPSLPFLTIPSSIVQAAFWPKGGSIPTPSARCVQAGRSLQPFPFISPFPDRLAAPPSSPEGWERSTVLPSGHPWRMLM